MVWRAGLSALGNVIACNDYVALVHTDIDKVCLLFVRIQVQKVGRQLVSICIYQGRLLHWEPSHLAIL